MKKVILQGFFMVTKPNQMLASLLKKTFKENLEANKDENCRRKMDM